MNKDEYREEVLNQLREQNNRLKSIEDSIWIFFVVCLLLLCAILAFHISEASDLSLIEHYLDPISAVNPLNEIVKLLYGIKNDVWLN
jgi:hypothetical protein